MTLLSAILMLAGASSASATSLQATVLSPRSGTISSSPDEPHHRAYGGDYSFDVTGAGDVFARFRNANGALSLTVAGIARACASGSFADGGDRITLNVLLNGAHVGTVTYAHLTNFSYTSGAVPVGARIGRTVTTGDGVHSSTCWTGSHVHVEPRNDSKYGCYFAGQLNQAAGPDTRLGIIGGERAAGVNVACSGDAEASASIGEGTFIRRPDNGVFRIAGGAPIYVSTWDAFGGGQPFTDVSWDYFNALPAHPRSGTFLVGSRTGRVFRVVGDGYRYYVGSWDPYGGPQPTVAVDDWALDNCDHLLCEPFGSLDLITGVPGGIRVAGWAMDPDSTDPITLHTYSDDTFAGAFTAAASRPDVDEVYHRGSAYGYDQQIALSAGSHHVCLYGINVGQGAGNPQLACSTVTALAKLGTRLRATASRSTVHPGTRVVLAGHLGIAGGSAGGHRIGFYRYASATHGWIRLTSKGTTSTGIARFTVHPRKTTRYEMRWDGSFSTASARADHRVTVR